MKSLVKFILLIILSFTGITQAEFVTIKINAVVGRIDFPSINGYINVGDPITGTYTYDTTAVDTLPSDPAVGIYHYNSPPNGIQLTVDGYVFKTDPTNVNFEIGIYNNSYGTDGYTVQGYNILPVTIGSYIYDVSHIYWQLDDSTKTAFSNDHLPTTAPDLSKFDDNGLLYIEYGSSYLPMIIANVTSVELLPEPCTIMLLGMGGLLMRRKTFRLA